MKQLKELKDLVGKTVVKTGDIENAISLFFSDDTFCVFIGVCYEENELEILFEDVKREYCHMDLLELGIISQDEHDVLKLETEESMRKWRNDCEMKEYRRLKEKFEKN